ncbi:MAG: dehypoxanthine futalosine cyclase [Bacteroidetes bacterium]|nr:dehypoxanthine futalosine cyclase [Bacteroidota bacterium]MBU1717901.1 dehypoxanthine futalosine cyclase [Bacteroidota bacterium]
MQDTREILTDILENKSVSHEEAVHLYLHAATEDLMRVADIIRKSKHPEGVVSWIIDRNVNISNICVSGCKFCNFHKSARSVEAYITRIEEYDEKIDVLYKLGGDQLLLQGGCNPNLDIRWYENLFFSLKSKHPNLKLHALGPPEVAYIAEISAISIQDTLQRLIAAGLDSLPGAGAEILSDRVRNIISPAKCNSQTWLKVMVEAHRQGLTTSATMMFGHIETPEERITHLELIRDVQEKRPRGAPGFISFIPWPFQSSGTTLIKEFPDIQKIQPVEYIRLIAISRIILHNIPNIQASWLTVGPEAASICLHAGANDLGSIMIEENVVSSAGATYVINANGMENLIRKTGFIPVRRNQHFEFISTKFGA